MDAFDVNTLLEEVSPESPCGENLEYDTTFSEMERAAQGKPEQQFGQTIIPGEPPDWAEVKRQALAVLQRTHDLRAGIYLTRALLHTDGLVGLRDGLALLRGWLERYWQSVHPQLDPDDDDDPTLRVNCLRSLVDPVTILRGVREAPLVSSRVLGRFSLRDLAVASGDLPAGDGESPPELSDIEAAFADSDLETLQQTARAVEEAIAHAQAIEQVVTEQAGAINAPELKDLVQLLAGAQRLLTGQLASRGVSAEAGSDRVLPAPSADPGGDGAALASGPTPGPPVGEITSRQDVLRALDKVCEYYERCEPSSPLPLLLKRAKRLATKSFLEILRDLAPDGLAQAESIGGVLQEDNSDED